LFAWRKTSVQSLKKHFTIPIICFVVTGIILLATGITHVYALLSLSMSAFVVGAMSLEFYRGTRARHSTNGEAYWLAFIKLILGYKRRYGGYIVHLAIVMMFVGFTGSAFTDEDDFTVRRGESFSIKDYTLRFDNLGPTNMGEYASYKATLLLFKNGQPDVYIEPEKRFYQIQETTTTEVAIRASFQEDLYVVLAGFSNEMDSATFTIYVNPLVNWVWMGMAVMVLGTLILFLPDQLGRGTPARGRQRTSSRAKPPIRSASRVEKAARSEE
jgi:cytochrome c-type biogenesis protein CcmF